MTDIREQKLVHAISKLKDCLDCQKFRAEKFQNDDSSVNRLTNIRFYGLLRIIFRDVCHGNDESFLSTFRYEGSTEADYNDAMFSDRFKGGRPIVLNYCNQFFMTFSRMRTGMAEDVLAAVFGISHSTVLKYYRTWVPILYRFLLDLPDHFIRPSNLRR